MKLVASGYMEGVEKGAREEQTQIQAITARRHQMGHEYVTSVTSGLDLLPQGLQLPRVQVSFYSAIWASQKAKRRLYDILEIFICLLSDILRCVQVIRPWCWYCEREFEDEKGECPNPLYIIRDLSAQF
jgi:hypothetical protein